MRPISKLVTCLGVVSGVFGTVFVLSSSAKLDTDRSASAIESSTSTPLSSTASFGISTTLVLAVPLSSTATMGISVNANDSEALSAFPFPLAAYQAHPYRHLKPQLPQGILSTGPILAQTIRAAKTGNPQAARTIASMLSSIVLLPGEHGGDGAAPHWLPPGESHEPSEWLQIAVDAKDPGALLDLLKHLLSRSVIGLPSQKEQSRAQFEQVLDVALTQRLSDAFAPAIFAYSSGSGFEVQPIRSLGYRLARDAVLGARLRPDTVDQWRKTKGGDQVLAVEFAQKILKKFS